MKIINLKEFLKLPEGTIYRKYSPSTFGDMCVKYENFGDRDFIYIELMDFDCDDESDYGNKRDEMGAGKSIPISFKEGMRDGLFDEDQLFLILEKEDLISLHNYIGSLL